MLVITCIHFLKEKNIIFSKHSMCNLEDLWYQLSFFQIQQRDGQLVTCCIAICLLTDLLSETRINWCSLTPDIFIVAYSDWGSPVLESNKVSKDVCISILTYKGRMKLFIQNSFHLPLFSFFFNSNVIIFKIFLNTIWFKYALLQQYFRKKLLPYLMISANRLAVGNFLVKSAAYIIVSCKTDWHSFGLCLCL